MLSLLEKNYEKCFINNFKLQNHFMLMLQQKQTKIVTFNANTQEIVTLDSCNGQSDKNCYVKCKYLGGITPCEPLSTVLAQ